MTETHETLLWIDGRETAAISGETFPVLDPGRGETIGRAARMIANSSIMFYFENHLGFDSISLEGHHGLRGDYWSSPAEALNLMRTELVIRESCGRNFSKSNASKAAFIHEEVQQKNLAKGSYFNLFNFRRRK